MLLIAAGCKSTEQPVREATDTGFYQNVLGSDIVRNQITRGFSSVRRVQNNVIYRTYQFDVDALPRRSEIEGAYFSNIATRSQTDSHSTAGTATVLHNQGGRAIIITAAHTVVQPDTIWYYQSGTSNHPDPIVEAVSVQETLYQYVFSDGGILTIELISYDARKDLALLITTDEVTGSDNLRQLEFSGGNTTELQWGDVVFAMGYPRGVQMVSQGVVSRSLHPIRSIILDLSINRGFSGGPAFAVRNDGGLEWVGVITSAMGEREFFLAPSPQLEEDFNPDLPYRGEMYISSSQRIYYGITNVVDIDEVRGFLTENRAALRRYGISLR
ncbi:MAG: hypothetical protein EA391_01050, partial [Balneolaceae bacterium]